MLRLRYAPVDPCCRDHHANLCVNGSEAESSGCLFGEIRSADDFPSILNDRSLMVENDTHQFDLWQFAPVEDARNLVPQAGNGKPEIVHL